MDRVVSGLVRQVVYENTSVSNPSTEANRRLLKYLGNPETRDAVYLRLIDHLNSDKNKTEARLLQTISLLKQHIPRFIPAGETLEMMDSFFVNVYSPDSNTSQSIRYVRCLIASCIKTINYTPKREAKPQKDHFSPYCDNNSPEIEAKRSLPSIGRRKSWYTVDLDNSTNNSDCELLEHSHHHDDGSNSKKSTLGTPQFDFSRGGGRAYEKLKFNEMTNEAEEDSEVSIVSNILQNRLHYQRNDSERKNESPEKNLRNLVPRQGRRKSLEISDFVGSLVAYSEESFNAVKVKKKEEQEKMFSGKLTIRRKRPQLFHYIYYSEQTPLDLTNQQMGKLLTALTDPPDLETRLMATKIIIKMLIDDYVHNDGQDVLSVLLPLGKQMLEVENPETRIHALNLLYNISVHSNMFGKVSILVEDHKADFEQETSGIPPSNPYIDYQEKVTRIHNDLFSVFKEMLAIIVDTGEKDYRVWNAALNLFFLFVTEGNKISLARVRLIPAKYIASMILHEEAAFAYQPRPWKIIAKLSSILINLFYDEKGEILDTNAIKDLGLDFMVKIYTQTTSADTLDNCFTFFFDYCVSTIRRRSSFIETSRNLTKKYLDVCLKVLSNIHAPFFCSHAFKYSTPDIWIEFSELAINEADWVIESNFDVNNRSSPSFDIDLGLSNDDINSIDYDRLIAVLKSIIEEFATISNILQSEFPQFEGLLKEFRLCHNCNTRNEFPDSVQEIIVKLESDLSSENSIIRRNAQNLFHSLYVHCLEENPNAVIKQSLDDIMTRLVSSESLQSENCATYLYLVDRLAYYLRVKVLRVTPSDDFSMEMQQESSISSVIQFVSVKLKILINQCGQKRHVLSVCNMIKAIDLLLTLLVTPRLPVHYLSGFQLYPPSWYSSRENEFTLSGRAKDVPDSIYEFILGGLSSVSQGLLPFVDIEVLVYLFLSLPKNFSDPRTCLIKMVIQRCSSDADDQDNPNSPLNKVGGISFFWVLVSDLDSRVAYLTSRFVLDELERNRPEEFRILVTSLLNRARESNDDLVVSNPYLQVKAIIGMMNEDSKKKQRKSPRVSANLATQN